MDYLQQSKFLVVTIVYVSFLLDNVLLTVVVPIIPDYLYTTDLLRLLVKASRARNNSRHHTDVDEKEMVDLAYKQLAPDSENIRVALLLSSKALVQLVAYPGVGALVAQLGCRVPLLVGSVSLFISAAMFAVAENYIWLFVARSLHGVASAFIGVAGMSAVAERFPTESGRSRAMGAVLGSVALGVLVGYPLGGMLYEWTGKSSPFILLAVLAAISTVLQYFFLELTPIAPSSPQDDGGIRQLLSDRYVLIVAGAILVSTLAMAVLEPCLPLWLMETLHPQKWQLGTVFIPDSVGYLVGTNCFGALAYQLGRGRVALAAMALVAVSAFLVPSASSVLQLAAPHFGMGLGIGIVDAALVPLLARLVDSCDTCNARYGSVYALQQAAVSLAYALGPLVGGAAVRALGFPLLMRLIGLLNLFYCPLLAWLAVVSPPAANEEEAPLTILKTSAPIVSYNTTTHPKQLTAYHRFYDSDDSD